MADPFAQMPIRTDMRHADGRCCRMVKNAKDQTKNSSDYFRRKHGPTDFKKNLGKGLFNNTTEFMVEIPAVF